MLKRVLLTIGLGFLPWIGFTVEQGGGNLLKDKMFDSPDIAISEKNGNLWIKEKSGRLLASTGAGNLTPADKLSVKLEKCPDFIADTTGLTIEVKPSGKIKESVIVRFHGIPAAQVPAGQDCVIEVWAKAAAASQPATLYFEGGTKEKKHFWRAKPIILTDKWKKYEFKQRLPDNLKDLWLRFDCNAAGTYRLNQPRVYQPVAATIPAAAAAENLIINGGAERGWYGIAIPGRKGQVPDNTPFVNWRGELLKDPFVDWSIDSTVAFSGKRSFKGVSKGNYCMNRFNFNPVRFAVGQPATFSVALKGDRPTKVHLGLFESSGIAYAKDVTIDTQWRTYRIEIPDWGKECKGVSRIGDVATGYGSSWELVYPQISFSGDVTVWIDNAVYSMSRQSPAPKSETVLLRGGIDHPWAAYQPGETVNAAYEIENASKEVRNVEIWYELYDYFGKVVERSQPQTIALASEATLKKSYRIAPALLGPFSLVFKSKDLKTADTATLSTYFGVFKKADKLHPWYGLDLCGSQSAKVLIDYLKAFGVGSVRLWSSYSKSLDRYRGFDNIKSYKDAGMYILFCLSDLKPVEDDIQFLVPKDPGPWAERIAVSVRQNKGLVDSYEIMNEPNIWPAPKENPDPAKYSFMSLENYVNILKTVSTVIRRDDPGVKISGPTTCHTDVIWTANVLGMGAGKYFDIITEHPYRSAPESPDYEKDLDALKNVFAKTGKNFPIFASECGNTISSSPECDIISNKTRESVDNSIRMQLIAYANGVGKYIHFAATLCAEGTGWNVFYLGNPDNDGNAIPNPYLYAMRNMMEQLDGAKPLGKCELGAAFRCYVFEKNGKRVAAIWKCQDEKSPSTVTCKTEKIPFAVFDTMGNPVKLAGTGFDRSFTVTGSPSYLTTELTLDELRNVLSHASISGMDNPFTVSLSVIDQQHFAVDVENRINKAISGKVDIISSGMVSGNSSQTFTDLPSGGKKRLVFTTVAPIGVKPQALKIRTMLNNSEIFTVNDFMLKTMLCHKASKPIRIDGDLGDWPANVEKVSLTDANAYKKVPELWKPADKNIRAEVWSSWRDDGLYLAIAVYKPVFFQNANGPMEMWQADSMQIAFDPLKNGKIAKLNEFKYDDDDFEYTVGLLKGEPMVYRHRASSVVYDGFQKNMGVVTDEVESAVKVMPGKTVYEIKFPPRSISPFRLEENNSMRWNFIINLNNGQGRMGWLELTPGIGQSKSPGEFMELVLVR